MARISFALALFMSTGGGIAIAEVEKNAQLIKASGMKVE